MAKKEKFSLLPEDTVVEVVMRKTMSFREYSDLKEKGVGKTWKIQAYQQGVYSDGYGKKVEE